VRRPRGLVGEIVESLASSIREGRLQPGEKLPTEAEIMARFDVSRTVVRESLSKLQASGLVETRHGIGTFVLQPQDAGNFKITAGDFATVADVISVLELRISLETEAAGLAPRGVRRKPQGHGKRPARLPRLHQPGLRRGAARLPVPHGSSALHRQPALRRPDDLPGHHDHPAPRA
jgi:DNA-binding transcriptional regulator YhcF (GntR family)